MLCANLGVLIGIIAVVFELRQTQTAMNAEASAVRAQMNMNIGDFRINHATHRIASKVRAGEDISDDEYAILQRLQFNMMRYFENLHYQSELGVLDDEIWNANLHSLSGMCSDAVFSYLFPNWPNEEPAGRFRSSFVELVSEGCKPGN